MQEKILMVNWSWYPTGGDWTYVSNVKQLYEEQGYEVIPFSTKNEKNITTDYEDYFINAQDYKILNRKKSLGNMVRAIRNSIYSFDAARKLDRILKEHTITVAHLHNIHHYQTPGIIWKLKKRGIKIIWTLHDYKIICPENSMVSNGKICERCIGGNYINCVINRCKKDSVLASMLAVAEAYFYHKSGVYEKVDAYLCPSAFLKKLFVQAGFSPEKLFVTNYCYRPSVASSEFGLKQSNKAIEKYILYIGRIEQIKGVKTLIDAALCSGYPLKIAGTGTALEEMKHYAARTNSSNISFLGFQSKDAVEKLLQDAAFVICPSEWFENFPFSVIESLSFGKPVIGSRIGGIPEMVIHNHTGLLFEPGNANDLQEKMTTLWTNDTLCRQLGKNARRHIQTLTDFPNHWNILNPILQNLPNAKKENIHGWCRWNAGRSISQSI